MILNSMQEKITAGASIAELWVWLYSIDCDDKERAQALQLLADIWGLA